MAEDVGNNSAPEQSAGRSELHAVDSPSISPAIESVSRAAPEITIDSDALEAQVKAPRFIVRARHRRNAVLAVWVVVAGTLGTIVGAVTSASINKPVPHIDVAAVKERQALHKSIAHLSREVAVMKSSLQTASRATHTQIAKINARLAAPPKPDITGSIRTVAAATPTPTPTPTPVLRSPPATLPVVTTPIPAPRPAARIAATESTAHLSVVPDWTIRSAREGAVLVDHHGELYQVVIGAVLPGLGPVEAIKRQDGRWMVVTSKGIIVSLRDRR
jgi:hypothetical protein